MTVLATRTHTKSADPDGPIRPEDYMAFIDHVTSCLNALMNRLGKQPFTEAELSGLNPSLLRDLQPYNGEDVVRAILDLFTQPGGFAGLRGKVDRHRIRKMRRGFEKTAKFFEHNTGTYLNDRGLREYPKRLPLMKKTAEVFWGANLPGAFDSRIDAELDASALVQFLYLPEAPEEAADALMRSAGAWYRTSQLVADTKAFDVWYKTLLKLLPRK